MTSLAPMKQKNHVPTPRERTEIQRLIRRDQEEIIRLTKHLALMEEETTTRKGSILNYKEALPIAETLRRIAEETRQKMAEHSDLLLPHSTDTSVQVLGEASSYQRYQKFLHEAQVAQQTAKAEEKKAIEKLAQLDSSINDIKQEVTTEESILSVLVLSKKDILDSIRRLEDGIALKTSGISARRIVPVEIWRYVFSLVVSEDEISFYDNKRKGLPPFTALRLSAVCQYWRSVVTMSSDLWAHIAIPHHDRISTNQRDRTAYYSTRCSPLLPKVYTYLHDIYVGKFTVNLSEFCRTTFVEYEELDMPTRDFSFLRGPSPSQFLQILSPKANTLQLSGYPNGDMEPIDIEIDSLSQIKHLKIKDRAIHLSGTTSGAPAIPLASITLENLQIEPSQLNNCLSRMGNLECLLMVGVTLRSNTLPSRITLPRLTRITCEFGVYPDISRFVAAPSLRDLTLVIGTTTIPYPQGVLEWMGSNGRNNTVISLTLREVQLDESESEILGTWILDHFSSVTNLRLDGRTPTFNLLLPPATLTPFTNVRSLIVANSAITEDELASFMQRFAALHSRIPTLAIHNCANLDINAIERLQRRNYISED